MPTAYNPYGIDSRDALLRVQITMEDYIVPSEHVDETKQKSMELKSDAIEVISAAIPRSTGRRVQGSDGDEATYPEDELTRTQVIQSGDSSGTVIRASQGCIWTDPIDELSTRSAISKPSNKTTSHDRIITSITTSARDKSTSPIVPGPGLELSHTTTFMTEGSEDLGTNGTVDDDTMDDDTLDTNDGTAISHDTFRVLRDHIHKVERFVESITLPECKTLDKMADRSFDEDESTINSVAYGMKATPFGMKTAPFDKIFSRSQCGALGPLRDWLKSHDGDDHDDFRSIVTQTTHGTGQSGKGPGFVSAIPVLKAERLAVAMRFSDTDGLPFDMSHVEKPLGETDESTIDETLNSFPLDERTYPQADDTFDDSVVDSEKDDGILSSRAKSRNKPDCEPLNLFECDEERNGESRTPILFADASSAQNQMTCSDLPVEAVDRALTHLAPLPKSSMAAPTKDSPKHTEGFPGLLEGNLKNLFRFRKNGKNALSKHARTQDPPLNSFPNTDGGFSGVGDQTSTTHELRMETDEELVLLRNRSKTLLPSPSSTLTSFFVCCKSTAKNISSRDCPFDEADRFKMDDNNNALAPDLSAAIGLAWAKQNAERTSRHKPTRLVS